MSHPANQHEIPAVVRQTLGRVRRSIRAYVWLEGVAVLLVAVGAAFWLGLGLDWIFEPTPGVRATVLILLAAVIAWIAYRWLIRRVFVRLPDSSIAILLERRFPQLHDHLLTAVDLAQSSELGDAYEPALVAQTHRLAAAAVADLPTQELLRRGPLVRAVVVALCLVAAIPVFAVASSDVFRFWLERIALSDEVWPRRVHLAVVGFEPDEDGARTHKLAQDDDYELVVHARMEAAIPDEVQIRYRLADGRRGRDTLVRVGEAVPGRDEYQLFRYEFKHVTSDMTFDVVGGDDRIRDLHLKIVDRPELVAMELACVYPDYLARPPRRLPVTGGMRIPEGSLLMLRAAATKPLADVRLQTSRAPELVSIEIPRDSDQQLQWDYGTLAADDVVTIQMTDEDGVASREPYRISLSVLPDELPQLAVRLAGIGNAITADAVIPLAGQITDEYGLSKIWFEYHVDDSPARKRFFKRQPANEQSRTELDRFDVRDADEPGGERAVELQAGQTLYLSVKASDGYNLNDAPRAGASQQFVLDVVTVPQLLALMERRELELRQRFEAIIARVTDTRNLLSRVDYNDQHGPSTDGSVEINSDENVSADETATSPVEQPDRALARRRLRVAGSLQNIMQSSHEVLDLAQAFGDIRDQLENNRVDNSDLKSRLQDQIALPLRQIGEKRLADLELQLKLVEDKAADARAGPPLLVEAIRQADETLVAMQQVLNNMLELESYNEVIALLRGIIHDQGALNERTKQQQADRIKSILDD